MSTLKNPLRTEYPTAEERRLSARPVPLGRTVATPAVIDAVPYKELADALGRHMRRDWGNVCEADWIANDRALKRGERLLSSYSARDGTEFWIITEWDRSYTTILLPSDY